MADQLNLVRRIAASGVTFTANVDHIHGGETVFLTPEEALNYGANPDAAAARHFGVAADVYRAWVDARGLIRCAGKTVADRRCSNMISGGAIGSPDEWDRVRRSGEHCAIHGGPTGGDR